jgi:heat-inducible transcriptional repressor
MGGVPEHTIRSAVDTLVELTQNLAVATIGNQLYMSGLSNLFGKPEFINGLQVQQVASLLDNLEPWLREAAPNEPLSVYIGAENPIGRAAGCSLIISRFRSPFSDRSYIGTLGPTRQSYRDVMMLVRRAGQELEEVLYA